MHEQLFETLRKDHEEVRNLLKRLKEENQTSQRERLLGKLREEIIPHMKGEEKVLYPSLKEHKEAKEDALESLEEHHAAQVALKELAKMPANDERFRAKTTVLMELVEHHVKEEEQNIFEDVRKFLNEDQGREILERFNKEKEKAKKTVH